MKRVIFVAFFLLMSAGIVFAQPVPPGTGGPGAVVGSTKGYPHMCCSDSSGSTPCYWQTCAEMRAGAAPGTPGYFRLLDIDSALGLDLTRLQYTTGGITNLQLRVMPTASTLFALDAQTANTFVPLSTYNSANAIAPLNVLGTAAVQYYWDAAAGTLWRTWGTNYEADNLSRVNAYGPWSHSLLHAIDTGGGVDRLVVEVPADDQSATNGLFVIPYTMAWDTVGSDWDRVHGGAFPGNFTTTSSGMKVMSGNYFWDIDNSMFVRDQGDDPDSDSVATTQVAPYRLTFGLVYQTDSTNWARDQGETADGGDINATRDAAYRFAFNYGWNGTSWSPYLIGATGGLQVEEVNWPNSYDAGSGWQDVHKEETAVVAPAKTADTAVDDAAGGITGDEVLASTYVLNTPNWCVIFKNEGGGSGDALADADVFVSPSGAAGEWENLDNSDCDTLASGAGTCSVCCHNCSYAYVKAEALCGAGDDTTVTTWLTGNKN